MSDSKQKEVRSETNVNKSEVYDDGVLTVSAKENLLLPQDYSLDVESKRGDVAISFDAPLQPTAASVISVTADESRAFEVVDDKQVGLAIDTKGGALVIKASAIREDAHTLRQGNTTIHAKNIFRGGTIKGSVVNIGDDTADIVVDGKPLNAEQYKGVDSRVDMSLQLPPLKRHVTFEDDQPDGTVAVEEGNITVTMGDQEGYVLIPRGNGKVKCANEKGIVVFNDKDGIAYKFGEVEDAPMLRVYTRKGNVEIK